MTKLDAKRAACHHAALILENAADSEMWNKYSENDVKKVMKEYHLLISKLNKQAEIPFAQKPS
jgi:hypothetical protein